MALKIKVSACLATITGVLTFFLAVFNGIRPITALYRGLFTIALFLALGYMLGILFEIYWQKMKEIKEDSETKGSNIDITNESDADILPVTDSSLDQTENILAEPGPTPEFKPLTPDAMMNFSTTEK